MNNEKEFKTIHNKPEVIQVGERAFLVGRDFLGTNREILDQCKLCNSQRENVVWADGKEITIKASAETVHGPLRTNYKVEAFSKRALLSESTAVHMHALISGIVENRNWPFMIFGKNKIIICHMEHGSLELARYDAIPIRMINKSTAKDSFESHYPYVVWTYIYEEGQDTMKLVYLEYKNRRWWSIMVVNGRETYSTGLTPGKFEFISTLEQYPKDLAAELWIHQNSQRIKTLTLYNYIRERDKDFKIATAEDAYKRCSGQSGTKVHTGLKDKIKGWLCS